MKIIVISFFAIVVLGFLIMYSGGLSPSVREFFHPAVSIPTSSPASSPAGAAPSTPVSSTPALKRSIYAPVYPRRATSSPPDAMPTPAGFHGPSGPPSVHGPSAPPPNY